MQYCDFGNTVPYLFLFEPEPKICQERYCKYSLEFEKKKKKIIFPDTGNLYLTENTFILHFEVTCDFTSSCK